MHLGRAGSASVVVGGLPLRKVTAQPLDLGDEPVAARAASAASAAEDRERADGACRPTKQPAAPRWDTNPQSETSELVPTVTPT